MRDAAASPFPPRQSATVRVDSIAEEHAYLAAWPHASGAWERLSRMLVPGEQGPEDHVTARAPDGATTVVRFAIGSFYGNPEAADGAPGERLSRVMRAGLDLAKAEGPLHPGSMPLYPVPAESHPGAVIVPLPILAADAGQRGLYAPARVAVVRWPSADPVGAGDAPGFDPARWPPARLGDWPPATVRDWPPQRLAAAIERFSAVWGRLLDAWFGDEANPRRGDERDEALILWSLLLPDPFRDLSAEVSPRFAEWIGASRRS